MARVVDVSRPQKPINFRYVATTPRGETVKGTIKTTTEIEAERFIIAKGYNPVIVEVAPSMFSLEEALPSLFKVKPRDVIVFSRQLATLLKSGISLLPALEILEGQAGSGRAFRSILGTVINSLQKDYPDFRMGENLPEFLFNDEFFHAILSPLSHLLFFP